MVDLFQLQRILTNRTFGLAPNSVTQETVASPWKRTSGFACGNCLDLYEEAVMRFRNRHNGASWLRGSEQLGEDAVEDQPMFDADEVGRNAPHVIRVGARLDQDCQQISQGLTDLGLDAAT